MGVDIKKLKPEDLKKLAALGKKEAVGANKALDVAVKAADDLAKQVKLLADIDKKNPEA